MNWNRNFSPRLREQIHGRAGKCCESCGVTITLEEMHADHKVPFGRRYGGKSNMANGQALCASCNMVKGQSVDPADLADPEKCDLASFRKHIGAIKPDTKQDRAANMIRRTDGASVREMSREIGITETAVRGLLYTDLRPKNFAFYCDRTQSPPRYYALSNGAVK